MQNQKKGKVNSMYQFMDIMIDLDGKYEEAVIYIKNGDNVEAIKKYNVLKIYRDMYLFAKERNMTIRELKNHLELIKFRGYNGVMMPYDVYDYENDGLDYSARRNYRNLHNYLNKKEKRRSKRIITLSGIGIITIISSTSMINYAIKKNNVYNNLYVELAYYSEGQLSKTLYNVLGDYKVFDQIMMSIIDERYSSLKGSDIEEFFQQLNYILESNDNNIRSYCLNEKQTNDRSCVINLNSYFQPNTIGNIALQSFESSFNALSRYGCENKYKLQKDELNYLTRRIMKFLMVDDYEIGVKDNGEKVFYNINSLSSISRYIILKRARSIIEMLNLSYDGYSNKQILNRIDFRLNGDIDSVKYNITNYKDKLVMCN